MIFLPKITKICLKFLNLLELHTKYSRDLFFRHGVFQINFVTHADKRYTSNPMHLSQRHMNSPFVGCCTPDMRVTGLCASLPPPMESHLHPYVFDAPLRCVREQKKRAAIGHKPNSAGSTDCPPIQCFLIFIRCFPRKWATAWLNVYTLMSHLHFASITISIARQHAECDAILLYYVCMSVCPSRCGMHPNECTHRQKFFHSFVWPSL